MANVEKIRKYKKYLDRCQDREVDNDELLSILRKLDRLDVTLEHLQTTGIGKSVNVFRKQEGGVGDKVRALVGKWKELVPAVSTPPPAQSPTLLGAVQCETVSETSYDGTVPQECDSTTAEVGQRVPYLAPSRVHLYRDSVDSYDSESKPPPGHDDICDSVCDSNQCDSNDVGLHTDKSSKSERTKYDNKHGHKHHGDDAAENDWGRKGHVNERNQKDSHKHHRDRTHKPAPEDRDRSCKGSGRGSKEKSKRQKSDRSRGTDHNTSGRENHAHDKQLSTHDKSLIGEERSRPVQQESSEQSDTATAKPASLYEPVRQKETDNHHNKEKDTDHTLGLKKYKTHKSDKEHKKDNHRDKEHTDGLLHKFKSEDSTGRSQAEKPETADLRKSERSDQDDILQMNEELLQDIEDFGELDDELATDSAKPSSLPSTEQAKDCHEHIQEKQVQKFVDVLKNKKRKPNPPTGGTNSKKLKAESKKEEEPVGNQGFSFDDLAQLDELKLKKHMKNKQKNLGRTSVSPSPSTQLSNARDPARSGSTNQTSGKTSGSSTREKLHTSTGSHSGRKHQSESSSKDKHDKSKKPSSKSSASRDVKVSSSRDKTDSSRERGHSSRNKSHPGHGSTDKVERGKHSSSSSDRGHKSSHMSHSRKDHQSSSSKKRSPDPVDVPLPTKQIKLLAEDIVGTLPEISPNYRPLPYLKPEVSNKHNQVADADDAMVSKKTTRTQIYSGRKQVYLSAVPSLFDACMGVLKDNIDNIESVGGIPADILRPVLERCNAGQLYNLEEYNPHFIGDTEDWWEKLCHKDFKSATPSEFESWRELYLRLHDEREAKLKKLTTNIAVSHARRNEPVRKTQLAYVDVLAKAPRGVRRQQQRHGTGGPTGQQDPLSKLSSHGSSHSQPKAPISRPRIQPVAGTSRAPPHKQAKVRTPMMQKAMRMMKKYR